MTSALAVPTATFPSEQLTDTSAEFSSAICGYGILRKSDTALYPGRFSAYLSVGSSDGVQVAPRAPRWRSPYQRQTWWPRKLIQNWTRG